MYQLKASLQAKTWDIVYCCCNPDTAYDFLVNEITDSIRCSIPIKTVTSRRAEHKPWLTRAISNSLKQKNTLYQRYVNKPNIENKTKYNVYKNKLVYI